jgi:hypothetical protein
MGGEGEEFNCHERNLSVGERARGGRQPAGYFGRPTWAGPVRSFSFFSVSFSFSVLKLLQHNLVQTGVNQAQKF